MAMMVTADHGNCEMMTDPVTGEPHTAHTLGPVPFILADPDLRGAPTGHTLPIREVRLSAGAGFVVAMAGDIMSMPGLPRVPAAERIGLTADGEVDGIF